MAQLDSADETEVSFQQGITILSGRNATNRTSLLQGIMAALGSNQASLKADAEEGSAILEFGEETYRQTLHRQNGTIATEGERESRLFTCRGSAGTGVNTLVRRVSRS